MRPISRRQLNGPSPWHGTLLNCRRVTIISCIYNYNIIYIVYSYIYIYTYIYIYIIFIIVYIQIPSYIPWNPMGKSGPFQGSLVYNDFDVSAACAAGFQGEAKVGCCQRPGVGRHTSIPSARMTGSVCMCIYIYNLWYIICGMCVMLCYAMFCSVLLCMLCMSCQVMLCHVMFCYVMSCYGMICYVMSCYVM